MAPTRSLMSRSTSASSPRSPPETVIGPTPSSNRPAVSRTRTLSWTSDRRRPRANPNPASRPAAEPHVPSRSKP